MTVAPHPMPRADQLRVAVVIPCFNDGATLEEAVRSAMDQDEAVELVVVNDGSTAPETLATLARIEAHRVRVIHQANAGLGPARMAGVAATSAPYVLPLDADDVLQPGAVAALADHLDASPSGALTWGRYQRFGDESTVQETAPTLDAWHITYQNDLPSTALLRRSALSETPGWRPNGGYEDWDLWMSLAERGWTGSGMDTIIYRYRREGTRMGHEAVGRHAELVAGLRRLHPELFAARRRNWRRSSAPLTLRLTLPLIDRLPVGPHGRRLLAGVASHLAHRRGVAVLLRRVREQGTGIAPAPNRKRRGGS